MPRSARPKRAPRSCTCTRAIRKAAGPDQSPQAFEPFLKVIKQRSACVVNIMTGGGQGMTLEQRVAPAARFKPGVASLNMGSMNFGLSTCAGVFRSR